MLVILLLLLFFSLLHHPLPSSRFNEVHASRLTWLVNDDH